MENVLVLLGTVDLIAHVKSVKELQQPVLDTEHVNVMEHVLVLLDGLTQSQLLKSVIAQLNALQAVQTTEHVNVEFVNVMPTGLLNQIVDVLMNVQQNVTKIKPVPVTEHVLVSQDSMEILVLKFLIAVTLLIVPSV